MNRITPDSVSILSVRVDRVTMDETLGILESMVAGVGSHHVMTVNPEFVITSLRNPAFRKVLDNADLALPDGIGMVLASRLFGRPVPERVTGVDVIWQIARLAAARGFRLFLLGAGPGVAERAAGVLAETHPGLVVAGTYSGSPDPAEEDGICRRISAARPDILLVAYGSPEQDLWISRTRGRLHVPVSIGVGGSFDFIAGVVKRAPRWMRNIGMEWLYRLVDQPWRWRRMLGLPRFGVLVTRQWLRSSL